MNIIFRKPTSEEVYKIYKHYTRVIAKMQEQGIDQWDEIYPNAAVIAADIDAGHMWIGEEDGKLLCAFSVNNQCEEEYISCPWKYPGEPFVVVHRLAVNPLFQRQGVGKSAMKFLEASAIENGVRTIRLDTFCGNPFAASLYENLGFKVIGFANWRKGRFQIMEKVLF